MRENKLLFSRLIFRLLLRHTVGRWDRVSIRGPREAGVNEKGGHAAPKNDVTAFRYFASMQASHLPQFASSLQSLPQPPLASGTEQSVHPPWETDAGAAFVAAPSPVARSSMIPS